MFIDKATMLREAPAALNRPDIPWEVTVEGDSIIARWKWMDATWIGEGQTTDEVRDFKYVVTLRDDGKFKSHEENVRRTDAVGVTGPRSRTNIGGPNSGGVGLNRSFGRSWGPSSQHEITIGLGRDNQTGKVGAMASVFDNSQVKKQIRGWLEANGWQKAGLFR